MFGATFGIAVGLGRTPPPPLLTEPSPVEVAIGYDFAGPPTLARVLFDWRFDLIFGTAAIVMAVLYLLGVRRLRRRGDAWPMGRTLAWMCGCAALLFTTSSGLGRYMPAMFSMHMVAHMLLSMLVPILLVLGAPVTLALRALPAAGRGEPPGPREWLLAALHSRVSRFLTNPIVATVVFVAGFYGLYFGGRFRRRGEQSRRAHADERPLPGQRIPLLLGGDRHRPDTAADTATRQGRDGVRVVAAARVLRCRADGHADRSGRDVLPVAAAELAHRPARRPAAGRWNRLGGRRSPACGGDDRLADPMAAQRSAHRQTARPGGRPRRRRGVGRL